MSVDLDVHPSRVSFLFFTQFGVYGASKGGLSGWSTETGDTFHHLLLLFPLDFTTRLSPECRTFIVYISFLQGLIVRYTLHTHR